LIGRWLRTGAGSTVVLTAATLFGAAMAVLTRSDVLPKDTLLNKPMLCLLHALVLGLWAAGWMNFWKHALNARGGRGFGIFVALVAAIAAELIQRWLPGHVCDLLGMTCNLAGALLAIVATRARRL
jgi:hypothetical protein